MWSWSVAIFFSVLVSDACKCNGLWGRDRGDRGRTSWLDGGYGSVAPAGIRHHRSADLDICMYGEL
jgi:hypothetical protein